MKKIILLITLNISTHLFAQEHNNPYVYPVDRETTSTVTKTSFYQEFFSVINLYYPELLNFRIQVLPIPEWEQAYLTAYTAQVGDVMKLGFWGGMARVPGMNDEAVTLITCHEVGHLLGGAPYIAIDHPMYEDVSSEGQADYFATKECLKRVWKNSDLKEVHDLPLALDKICKKRSHTSYDLRLCQKVMKGIEGFRHVMELLKKESGMLNYNGHAHEVVTETIYNAYPSNQCRFDTLVAGLFDEPRPKCWFVDN